MSKTSAEQMVLDSLSMSAEALSDLSMSKIVRQRTAAKSLDHSDRGPRATELSVMWCCLRSLYVPLQGFVDLPTKQLHAQSETTERMTAYLFEETVNLFEDSIKLLSQERARICFALSALRDHLQEYIVRRVIM